MPKAEKLIVGCGYLGQRVALAWQSSQSRVFAVTRSLAKADSLRQRALEPVIADIMEPRSLCALPSISTVLFAVGRDRDADYSIRELYVRGFKNLLDSLSSSVDRLIYISSTGVYGSDHDEVVTERSSCRPTRPGSQAHLAAEELLRNHALGSRALILRLAGIYGPGRVPSRDALATGLAWRGPLDSYLNLIHVEDAVECILAAEQRAALPDLFIVSDGHPVLRQDYYLEVVKLAKIDPSLLTRSIAGHSPGHRGGKRVSNEKLAGQLQVKFRFPTYREGLAQAMGRTP